MVTPVKKITWTKQAILQFKKSIEYIREDSPQNAEKVKHTILQKLRPFNPPSSATVLTNTKETMMTTSFTFKY